MVPQAGSSKNPEQTARRRQKTLITSSFAMSRNYLRNSGGFFSEHHIMVNFKPSNRNVQQKFVHPKNKTPKHKPSNVVYAVQCSQDCTGLMAQQRRAISSGQDSAVHLHLKDNNVNILAIEDSWFERGLKETIHVKLERQSLNRGGGL